jgi:hypothetical protein
MSIDPHTWAAAQRGSKATLAGAMAADAVPRQRELVCEWQSPDGNPHPVDLQLSCFGANTPAQSPFGTGPFFPVGNPSDAVFRAIPGGCGFFEILLGGGPDARTVYCDLVANGRIALGGQRSVRVNACRWGGVVSAVAITTQAAVIPAEGTGSLIPYTIPIWQLAAGTQKSITGLPSGAQYVEFKPLNTFAPGNPNAAHIILTNAVTLERDYVNYVFAPPWSPEDFVSNEAGFAGGQLDVLNANALAALSGWIRFWCR